MLDPLPIQPHTYEVVAANAENQGVSDAHRRLGRTLRRLLAASLDPRLDEAGAAAVDAALAPVVTDLPPPAPTRYSDDDRARFPAAGAAVINGRGTHPFFGCLAPVGSDVEIGHDGTQLTIRLTFDVRHEGMPGYVHGGHVTAGFDYALGQTAASAAVGGPTGTLTVRFRRPTPIHVPVEYRCRTIAREGRRTTVTGELVRTDDDTLCCDAEAIFVSPTAT